jgi:predicted phosphodiesterase
LAGPAEGRTLKLGLLADIHERVRPLRAALARFQAEGVERVVVLGDVFAAGTAAEETAALLARAGAAGVWGNHDFGLCRDPSDWMRVHYSARVLEFAGSLQPRLVLGDCLFTHVEPWLDPEDLEQLWRCDDLPGIAESTARSFAAAPQRLLFHGHFHAWRLESPVGPLAWRGERPVCLAEGRYLVAIAALCEGYCAVLDTGTGWLRPFRIG